MTVAGRAPRVQPMVLVLEGEGAGRAVPVPSDWPLLIGRRAGVGLRVLGDEVSRDHARLVLRDDRLWLEDLGSRNGTFLNGVLVERATVADGDRIQVGAHTLLQVSLGDDASTAYQRLMVELARRDPRTGLFDALYLVESVTGEASLAARLGHPLSLLVVVVDGFGPRRHRLGAQGADRFLEEIGRHLERQVRVEDLVASLDGPAFGVLCRGLDAEGAHTLAERLRRSCEDGVPELSEGGPVSVSIGVAAVDDAPAHVQLEVARAAADAAREAGGNRVRRV